MAAQDFIKHGCGRIVPAKPGVCWHCLERERAAVPPERIVLTHETQGIDAERPDGPKQPFVGAMAPFPPTSVATLCTTRIATYTMVDFQATELVLTASCPDGRSALPWVRLDDLRCGTRSAVVTSNGMNLFAIDDDECRVFRWRLPEWFFCRAGASVCFTVCNTYGRTLLVSGCLMGRETRVLEPGEPEGW